MNVGYQTTRDTYMLFFGFDVSTGKAESRMNTKTVVLGVIGSDCHAVGNKIIEHALTREGFNVINIGVMVSQDEFIDAAIETGANAILVSSIYGHGEIDCDDGVVECPYHQGAFEIATGRPAGAPCSIPLRVYRVEVKDEAIYAAIDETEAACP